MLNLTRSLEAGDSTAGPTRRDFLSYGAALAALPMLEARLNASARTAGLAALPPYTKPTLIAHRGASAEAPEHTLAAYELALKHQADFVEPDLQMTKDGVLICLHDTTLERTTNVAQVFAGRSVQVRDKKVWA